VYGRGDAVNLNVRSPMYEDSSLGAVPYLEAVATVDSNNDTATIFAVNRSMDGELSLDCDIRDFDKYRVVEHITFTSKDRYAVNSMKQPNRVVPKSDGNAKVVKGKLTATLLKMSWNVIRMAKK
jgi:alpha-L-arabinofuranosidase